MIGKGRFYLWVNGQYLWKNIKILSIIIILFIILSVSYTFLKQKTIGKYSGELIIKITCKDATCDVPTIVQYEQLQKKIKLLVLEEELIDQLSNNLQESIDEEMITSSIHFHVHNDQLTIHLFHDDVLFVPITQQFMINNIENLLMEYDMNIVHQEIKKQSFIPVIYQALLVGTILGLTVITLEEPKRGKINE